eukprot:SAG11_NODE_147_length_14771_cov_3.279648_14_plen_112_part_00
MTYTLHVHETITSSKACSVAATDGLRWKFFRPRSYDTNGDGRIDYRELVLGCGKTFGRAMGGEAGRIQMLFSIYDADNSGTVTEDELLALVRARQEEIVGYSDLIRAMLQV